MIWEMFGVLLYENNAFEVINQCFDMRLKQVLKLESTTAFKITSPRA